MMGNKEIEMVTRINKDIQNLITDLNRPVIDGHAGFKDPSTDRKSHQPYG